MLSRLSHLIQDLHRPISELCDYFLAMIGVGLVPAREAMPIVREEARKALETDPSLPEAQAMLGIVAAVFDYDWKEAERRFGLAMARDPVSPQVRYWYGGFYLCADRQNTGSRRRTGART